MHRLNQSDLIEIDKMLRPAINETAKTGDARDSYSDGKYNHLRRCYDTPPPAAQEIIQHFDMLVEVAGAHFGILAAIEAFCKHDFKTEHYYDQSLMGVARLLEMEMIRCDYKLDSDESYPLFVAILSVCKSKLNNNNT